MKILVGSKNPVKLKAVEETFAMYFNSVEVLGIKVESNVSDQPINDETFKGAENRARSLATLNEEQKLNADFFVGIEGGISSIYDNWFAFGAMCVMDKDGKKTFGTSAHFELPEIVTNELLKGRELGHVMDEIMREENTKQKGGAIAYFTLGKMDRKQLYIPGLISALVPFNHKPMYFSK
ncbi:MAG: inosine/xanthosine triphosphatase [Melioribacteraceae bacterium]|nr:inosine/xanthosine triphosphatase [Melioribacteraceae bacterium]